MLKDKQVFATDQFQNVAAVKSIIKQPEDTNGDTLIKRIAINLLN